VAAVTAVRANAARSFCDTRTGVDIGQEGLIVAALPNSDAASWGTVSCALRLCKQESRSHG
jgi:hypothetical protein